MPSLPNAEIHWEPGGELQQLDEGDVASRLGPIEEELCLLSGGLANSNIRVGEDRVLRIFRRDAGQLPKEAALLKNNWQGFRSPQILDQGVDYLVLEYVGHGPLPDSADSGEKVGRALAEIHRASYPVHGEFDGTGAVQRPMPDFPDALRSHARSQIAKGPAEHRDLAEAAFAHLNERYSRLTELSQRPTRLHGDFKASNLHLAEDGQLLVLDWEFAYAGPPMMDVGQLLRWFPSEAFLEGFAGAYRREGGDLPEDWRQVSGDFDLANLAGLLAGSPEGSRRAADVVARMRRTLGLAP